MIHEVVCGKAQGTTPKRKAAIAAIRTTNNSELTAFRARDRYGRARV